jgi:hypothetical protein
MRFAKRAFGAFTHDSLTLGKHFAQKHFAQGSPHIKGEGSSTLFVLFAYA